MKFEIIAFQHGSNARIPAMRLFFKFNYFQRLFGKSNYSSLFTKEGQYWFENFDNGKQFITDEGTNTFIQNLYDECCQQSKSLSGSKKRLSVFK